MAGGTATPCTIPTAIPVPISNPQNDTAFLVAFTIPHPNSTGLATLLTKTSLITPLWTPTITTILTPQALLPHLSPPSLFSLSAIAFPSPSSISSLSSALFSFSSPPLPPLGPTFSLFALGTDSELLSPQFILSLCESPSRVRVLVPPVSNPSGMVRSLVVGRNRRILCPVPRVVGIEEPPVVPGFLRELSGAGWVQVRVYAYKTRWVGEGCLEGLFGIGEGLELDGLVFEGVEGGWVGLGMVRRRWHGLVVAAHGPVTAEGAERLGVDVDVVSERFGRFEGVVEALKSRLLER